MNFGHCFRCGAALAGERPVVCAACGYESFNNARPTGGVAILDERHRLLLVKRAREPKRGMWELPGGFCDTWELPAQAAVREAREELGVDVELVRLLGMYVGEYHFQGEVVPVLDFFWLARLMPGQSIVLDRGESVESNWFPLDDLPELAFETMPCAIHDLISTVHQKDHYTKGQLAQ